jgi:hypothetical protein
MRDPDGAVPIDLVPAGASLHVEVPGAGFDVIQAAHARARFLGSMLIDAKVGNLNGARVKMATGYLPNPQPMPIRPNLDDSELVATIGETVRSWDGEQGPAAPRVHTF